MGQPYVELIIVVMSSFSEYDQRMMMGNYRPPNPFERREREPRIEILEPSEGRISVDVMDMNTGMRYRKEFILEYNNTKGRKAFHPSASDDIGTLNVKSTVGKLLMLFL